MTSLFLLLRALALALTSAVALVRSQDVSGASSSGDLTDNSEPTSTSSAAASPSATGITKVVQVFFIDERSYEGLPYTLLHRDSGSVIGVNADLTTLVITSTRVDQRPSPTHTRTDNVTTGIITLASSHRVGHVNNTTGQPSTITQGPATFMFTGTRFGPDHTLINRCSLNGTEFAVCNLTHVGSAWYARAGTSWNGTYSTYSYNWTKGDRFGFAPVTITAGAELLSEGEPTASSSPNAALRAWGGGGDGGGGRSNNGLLRGFLEWGGPAVVAFMVGAGVALGMVIVP